MLALLCDAFIPSLSADQCSTDAIKETLDAMHPSLRDESDLLFADTARIKAFQQYLQRGSLEMDIHLMTAQALQKLTTPSEKQQLYLLLKVLSTSIGCFLVTGSPAAVQDMSLDSRVHLLCGFRDSPLVPLRAFYQVRCNSDFAPIIEFISQ